MLEISTASLVENKYGVWLRAPYSTKVIIRLSNGQAIDFYVDSMEWEHVCLYVPDGVSVLCIGEVY